jgi:6-phosphogluconolactonase (cycloisomerase 2 family)
MVMGRQTIVLICLLVSISACGGGSSPQPPAPLTYSVGGTITGLDAGESVHLQDNGGDDLISANGAFTFATQIASGGAYAVTVSPPAGKGCSITSASGTASANVTSVAVACFSDPPPLLPITIGGSVSGLVGQGLILELVRTSPGGAFVSQVLPISGNADFVFPDSIATNTSHVGWHVDIQVQPHTPTQRCVLRNAGIPIPGPNVTDVGVVCAEFAYVANAADNTISAFSIDATTGAIASVGPSVSAGTSTSAIAGTSDKKYLFVSNQGSNDVSAFAIDAVNGNLTTVPGSPFAVGRKPRAVSLWGEYLFVANSGSDSVSGYLVDQSTGVPTPLYHSPYATGTGPSAIAIHPSSPFLYTANAGGDIYAFRIDPGLTPIAGPLFTSGSSVSSLAFGAGGKFLYAADATGGTASVIGFSVDPNAGALASLPGFPLPSCNYIVADQTGTYLYATAGTDVLGYSIDAQTGALNLLPGFPVAVGASADSVTIDPTNQFLYVRNGSAGTVTGFQLHGTTGALTPMPGSPFTVGTSADLIATL